MKFAEDAYLLSTSDPISLLGRSRIRSASWYTDVSSGPSAHEVNVKETCCPGKREGKAGWKKEEGSLCIITYIVTSK
jgi:hypothetical protein